MIDKISAGVYTLAGPNELYLSQEDLDPVTLGGDEIIAETVYTAISPGTEVSAYLGVEPLRSDVKMYPRVVGYCNIARIVRMGSLVEGWTIGDYFLSFQSHRTHFKCNVGDFMLKVNERQAKDAVASYLYHLGYHSLITADLRAGHNLAVIGYGTLGYTCSVMSSISGAATMVFTNQIEYRRLIESKGMKCFTKSNVDLDAIMSFTNGVGVDVVVNTSNTWDDWFLSLALVNTGGVIVNLGFPGRGQGLPESNPLDPKYLYMKNVTVKYLSSMNVKGVPHEIQRFNRERNLRYIMNLIERGVINCKEILTEEISFKSLKEQYEKYAKRDSGLFSTLVNWEK